MATTEILPFATGVSADVQSQADYAAASSTTNGFSVGIAEPAELNKVWRQSSFVAAGLANYLVSKGINVPDDGDLAAFIANLTLGIDGYTAPFTGAVPTTISEKLSEITSISDFGGDLALALTGIGSTKISLFINESISVANDATIPETLEIVVKKGCVITVAAGKTLTFNGQLDAGLYQIFGATGTVILGKTCVEEAYPEWWGAIADGSTDCQPAMTLYAAALMASTSGVITFNLSSGNYYLATPVTLNLQATFQGIRIQGTAAISNYVNKGSIVSGAAAIDSMFIFRATLLTTSFFYSFECRNVAFLSSTLGTAGPKSALLSLGGGQSARPFIVENCTFKGFDAAIKSDMTGSALSTGICNVTIRNNFFLNNNLALKGVGTDSIVNLDFSNNQAGTGGGINASVGGPYLISQNTMESNANSIVITGGLHNGEICRNYFEANTGDLINVSATAPFSTVYIHSNYASNISGTSIRTSGVHVRLPDDLSWAGVYTRINATTGKSIVNSQSIVYPVSLAIGDVSLDVTSVALKSTLTPASLTSGAYSNAVGAVQKTPMSESVNVDTINGTGVYRSFAVNVVTGDWLVFSCLARRRVGTGAFYVEALNSGSTASIGTSNTNTGNDMVGIGEWFFVMKFFQVTGNSGASINFGWNTAAGTQVDVTSTYIYKVAAPTVNSPIYLALPAI